MPVTGLGMLGSGTRLPWDNVADNTNVLPFVKKEPAMGLEGEGKPYMGGSNTGKVLRFPDQYDRAISGLEKTMPRATDMQKFNEAVSNQNAARRGEEPAPMSMAPQAPAEVVKMPGFEGPIKAPKYNQALIQRGKSTQAAVEASPNVTDLNRAPSQYDVIKNIVQNPLKYPQVNMEEMMRQRLSPEDYKRMRGELSPPQPPAPKNLVTQVDLQRIGQDYGLTMDQMMNAMNGVSATGVNPTEANLKFYLARMRQQGLFNPTVPPPGE